MIQYKYKFNKNTKYFRPDRGLQNKIIVGSIHIRALQQQNWLSNFCREILSHKTDNDI